MSGVLDAIKGVFSGPPDAPNPGKTAQQQMDINRQAMEDSSRFNQIGQSGPGYNISYSGEIGDPNRTMNYSLDPNREALAQLMGQSAVNQGQMIGGDIDYSGVAGVPNYGDFGDRAQQVEGDMYDAMMSRIRPDLDRTARRTETNLANRGIPQGGEAYNDVTESLRRSEQDTIMGVAGNAINLGRDESNRLFNQQLQSNQAGMSNLFNDRNQNMNEFAMMLNANPYNSTQVQSPTQYNMSPADLMGATNNQYAADSANYQAGLGGLASVGGMIGMGAMMSDIRTKHNIVPRGTMSSGLPFYDFSYIGSDERLTGVMSHEVMELFPEAIIMTSSGYMAVDYERIH